jgi:hypothetical protein
LTDYGLTWINPTHSKRRTRYRSSYPSEMDILNTDLEARIAFHSDAVVGSASGKNHSGCKSPERDTEANDELVRQVQGLESVVIKTTPL